MEPTVRFYFSFRSPYAWFAAERWAAEIGSLAPIVERIPFYPTAETFPSDPTRVPAKFAYIIKDMLRLARDFGLTVKPPPALETDWARAHAAYLAVHAEEPQRSERFMIEMFRARFSLGQDVALDPVIEEAAARAGVSGLAAIRGAASPALQAEVTHNFVLGQQRDGIFGAPSFVASGELFWGHDRLPHLRRLLLANAAQPIDGPAL